MSKSLDNLIYLDRISLQKGWRAFWTCGKSLLRAGMKEREMLVAEIMRTALGYLSSANKNCKKNMQSNFRDLKMTS